jgi:predicted lactoylglutathione lyase
VEQRISLVTLGVADVGAAKAFYQRLGWVVGLEIQETVFFQAGGLIVTLWGRDKLAADCGVVDSGGWGGIALAHNVGSREEVNRIIDDARGAGAQISREPAETFYGGYAGVFLDLDGHAWEVAHNPGFGLSEDGTVTLPSADRPG